MAAHVVHSSSLIKLRYNVARVKMWSKTNMIPSGLMIDYTRPELNLVIYLLDYFIIAKS